MRKFTSILLVLALLVPIVASTQAVTTTNYTYEYDVDSGTATYCKLLGNGDNPRGGPIQGRGTLTSVSTTVDASDTTAFRDAGAGDVLVVSQAGAQVLAVIASKTDGDTVVLTAAPGTAFAAAPWRWLNLVCGTTDEDGWVDVGDNAQKNLTVQYEQGDITLDVRFECRGGYIGALPIVVYPGEADTCGAGGTLASGYCQFSSGGVGITNRLSLIDLWPWKQCRVAVKFNGADTSEAGANLEKVTIGLEMRQN